QCGGSDGAIGLVLQDDGAVAVGRLRIRAGRYRRYIFGRIDRGQGDGKVGVQKVTGLYVDVEGVVVAAGMDRNVNVRDERAVCEVDEGIDQREVGGRVRNGRADGERAAHIRNGVRR